MNPSSDRQACPSREPWWSLVYTSKLDQEIRMRLLERPTRKVEGAS